MGAAGMLPSVRMPGLLPEEALQVPPPRVGQHTVRILRDSGFTDAQIASVLKSGVAVQASEAATESGAEG